jgi:hypothetical protein
VTNTIGYTRKEVNKKRFDEECAEVNEEKNATREKAIQNNTPEEPRMLTNKPAQIRGVCLVRGSLTKRL